jgi:hypothetical protein
MRSPLDLLELPFSFWQLPLLTEGEFAREARSRGVLLSLSQIEGLHRLRLLTPFFRFQRDGRAIAAAARRGDPYAWETADWLPKKPADLLEAREAGRLHDPASEHFIARERLDREVGDIPYRASAYLYSHHQLLSLPILKNVLPTLAWGSAGQYQASNESPARLTYLRNVTASLRELAVALSALEPIYLPPIVGLRAFQWEYEEYDKWRRKQPAQAMLDWLGGDSDWIKTKADELLGQADLSDPLGDWIRVIREAPPKKWDSLKDEARSAIDLRIGAEILLGYYERLVKARKAPALPKPEGRYRGEYDYRLKPTGKLDRTFMDFGISPHPRVLLVLEGDTELLLFPRVMALFGIRTDREYIAVENARSVNTDLAPLIEYAISPRTELDEQRRRLRLQRTATRLLVMMDPEGPYESPEGLQEQKSKWVSRIMKTLPKEHRTESVWQSIETLITVDTWNREGESFEFANFTDGQLNRAVANARRGRSQPDRTAKIKELRENRGNLNEVLGSRTSKPQLAEALWPILEQKIERARKRNTHLRIPVVRALGQARDMARKPHSNLVIPLNDEAST